MEVAGCEFEGCRLAYRSEGSGPPLVMIQGVGACGLGWNPLVEVLQRRFTCVMFDNRGIGASQPAAKALTVPAMAADVLALLRHLGWRSAHLVGHSLGGLIALEAALAEAQCVRSLSLLCTFPRGAAAMRPKPKLVWIGLRLALGTRRVRRHACMDLVLSRAEARGYPPATGERLSRILGHELEDVPAITGRQLRAMWRHDVTPRLAKLSGIPTLVINGGADLLAPPSSGKAIADHVPGARYVEMPGSAHAFPILHPERCSAILLEHLERAEAAHGV